MYLFNTVNYESLNKNGFLLFRNVLDESDLVIFEKSIIDSDTLNYSNLKYFIDNCFMKKVNSILHWDCLYSKFRFSNSKNSNLKDANRFHGDLYNFTQETTIPIFTGLCNLDESDLEVVPGSHIKGYEPDIKDRIKIHIYPGDILIFHANLYHRGIPSKNQRRLLQIFEIFPSPQTHDLYKEKLLVVLTNKTIIMNMMNYINGMFIKNVSGEVSLIDKFHFWLLKNDLQYKITGIDISNSDKKDHIVGYIPGVVKSFNNQIDKWNINMNIIGHRTVYAQSFIEYFIFFLVFILILYKFNKRNE